MINIHCPSHFAVQSLKSNREDAKHEKGEIVFSSIPENRIDENSHPACGRNDSIILQQVIRVNMEVSYYG